MPSSRTRKRSAFWFWFSALLIGGLAAAVFAWPHAKNRYNRWRTQRDVRQASEFLAQGDLRHAILSAKNALLHSPLDVGAMRIMAKSLETAGTPEAGQWRARLDALQPDDAENALARARAALKAGAVETAEELVKGLDPADRNSVAFHSVAAAIATEKHDMASAESHWAEAVRLEPKESRHQLSLASVRLESRTPGVREAGLNALRELRDKPATSVEALRLLLTDAVRHLETAAAMEAADALVADARSQFADRLSRLTSLRLLHDARSGPYLLGLRDATMTAPADLSALLSWMNGHDLSMMVSEWVKQMPEDLIAKPPVCIAVAEAHLHLGAWKELENIVMLSSWGDTEYLRRAMLARALEHTGEAGESETEWQAAVTVAGRHPDALQRLARMAIQANWEARAGEILWALAKLPGCPQWVLNSLWQTAYRRGETAQLQKLSATLVKMDPKGIASRNNYAFLSLLTRSNEGDPQRLVENLHRENPENPTIASTYGLSLFQQGRTEEAIRVMSALKPEDLRQPQVALYYAIFLISAGQSEKAEEYLGLSAGWPMLPEEKALLVRTQTPKTDGQARPSATASPTPSRSRQ